MTSGRERLAELGAAVKAALLAEEQAENARAAAGKRERDALLAWVNTADVAGYGSAAAGEAGMAAAVAAGDSVAAAAAAVVAASKTDEARQQWAEVGQALIIREGLQ